MDTTDVYTKIRILKMEEIEDPEDSEHEYETSAIYYNVIKIEGDENIQEEFFNTILQNKIKFIDLEHIYYMIEELRVYKFNEKVLRIIDISHFPMIVCHIDDDELPTLEDYKTYDIEIYNHLVNNVEEDNVSFIVINTNNLIKTLGYVNMKNHYGAFL